MQEAIPALQAPGSDDIHLEGVHDNEKTRKHHQQRPVHRSEDLLRAHPAQKEHASRDEGHDSDRLSCEEKANRDEGHGDALEEESRPIAMSR